MPGSEPLPIRMPFPPKGPVGCFGFTFGYAQKAIFFTTEALRFLDRESPESKPRDRPYRSQKAFSAQVS